MVYLQAAGQPVVGQLAAHVTPLTARQAAVPQGNLTEHFTFYTLHFTFYFLHFTFYILRFTVYSLQFLQKGLAVETFRFLSALQPESSSYLKPKSSESLKQGEEQEEESELEWW